MKIYVVTEGCYSDYSIITATTDEKLAYEIRDKFARDNTWEESKARVEVYEDAEIFLKPCYFMKFDEGGNVNYLEERIDSYNYRQSCGSNVYGGFYASVVVDNEEAAIKIGAERRAMYLAHENGLC